MDVFAKMGCVGIQSVGQNNQFTNRKTGGVSGVRERLSEKVVGFSPQGKHIGRIRSMACLAASLRPLHTLVHLKERSIVDCVQLLLLIGWRRLLGGTLGASAWLVHLRPLGMAVSGGRIGTLQGGDFTL